MGFCVGQNKHTSLPKPFEIVISISGFCDGFDMVVDCLGDPVMIPNIILGFAKSIRNFKPPLVIRTTDFLDDWRFAIFEI